MDAIKFSGSANRFLRVVSLMTEAPPARLGTGVALLKGMHEFRQGFPPRPSMGEAHLTGEGAIALAAKEAAHG